jgi:spermidine synthase
MQFRRTQFILSSVLLGFSSMVAQIVLFREMMVTFYGNELSFGVMLFVWLFWGGVGAFWGNKVVKSSPRKLSFCYLSISLLTLLTIIVIRFSKLILGTAPAEIVGFLPMLLFSFLGMSVFCFLLGLTFVLNSKSWTFDQSLVFLVNRVYLWESVGTGLGGFIATFILIPNISNFQIIVLVFSLNLLLSAFLSTKGLRNISKVIIWILTFLVIIGFKGLKLDEKLDSSSLNAIWRGLPLIHSEDTKYGNIAVVKKNEQITFYENGLMLFSYPDEFSSEEAVHFALLEHPNPKTILLIGGGLGGAITQALKYKDLKIDFVELDPKLIKIGETYLPQEEIRSLENPLVKMYFQDGRLFVKERLSEIVSVGEEEVKSPQSPSKSQSPSHSPSQYDVIILNLPDPHTAQLGRFFTFEFFGMIKSILKKDGIFSFRVSSAENYISQELGLYLSSLYRTLKLNFAEVVVLPGSNNVFLASNRKGILFESWQKLVERLKERKISTKFVNEHFLPDRLSSMRVEYLKNNITSEASRINYDLKPISYFYNTILWSKQFKSIEKPVFLFLSKIKPFWFICVIALIFVLGFSACLVSRSRLSNLALSAIFTAGFTSIFLEIIILLSFQIFYGYIYSKVGIILTLFMLGLAFGAFLIQKRTSQRRINFKNLILIQLFQVILVSFLLFLVFYFYKISPPQFLVECLLLLVITLSGIIGGMEFTLANHLFLEKKSTKRAGTGYSVDLFGSSLSSILASAILIPLLGIPTTLIMILVTNFLCFFFLLAYQKLA